MHARHFCTICTAVLLTIAASSQMEAQLRAFWLETTLTSNTLNDAFNFNDAEVNIGIEFPTEWEPVLSSRMSILVTLLDVQINNGSFSNGVNVSDNYLISAFALLGAAFIKCPPGEDCSWSDKKNQRVLAAIFGAPHWLPNLGFALTIYEAPCCALTVYAQQEMNYYILNNKGNSYGFKSGLAFQFERLRFNLGARKYIHDTFNNYDWNAMASVSYLLHVTRS